MKKMLKRADGSKSQRGLWDNIRAKAASNKKAGKKGKAPSKDMLEQEAKIKAKMKMGGDWMQESKELKFGGPSKRKKYQTAPPPEENINIPTAVKYTNFTVTPTEEPKEKVKLSGESRGGRTAGGGGGGPKGFDKQCIGSDCKKMMASSSGKTTKYEGPGAPGLSTRPQYSDRLANLTEEERIAGLENEAYYKAQAEASIAERKREAFIRSGKGVRSTGTEDTSENLFTKYNYAPNFRETLKKFGGKRKSIKK